MHELTRRGVFALTAAPVLAAAGVPSEKERQVRRTLVGITRRAAANLAEAQAWPQSVPSATYVLQRCLTELRLFDSGQGEIRLVCKLPLVPGAFTGSAADIVPWPAAA